MNDVGLVLKGMRMGRSLPLTSGRSRSYHPFRRHVVCTYRHRTAFDLPGAVQAAGREASMSMNPIHVRGGGCNSRIFIGASGLIRVAPALVRKQAYRLEVQAPLSSMREAC